jgi:hypothetical protein
MLLLLANRIETITYDNGKKSSPVTPKSQPRWGRYSILQNHITRENAASTNTPTASSDSTPQKVQISLFCLMLLSQGSRTNSTLAKKDTRLPNPSRGFLRREGSWPLHFTAEWAP